MYVPVLHARQSETRAVKGIADRIKASGNVYPLLIPVRDDPGEIGKGLAAADAATKVLSGIELPFALLVTPYAPKVEATQAELVDVINKYDKGHRVIPVVAVTSGKPIGLIEAEIRALPGDRQFSILHVTPAPNPIKLIEVLKTFAARIAVHYFYRDECDDFYCDRWKACYRVLIEDGFNRLDRNADYAGHADEPYSKLGFEHRALGFNAYGDHTICGEKYIPGGGPALTVAIHLSYPSLLDGTPYSEIAMRHFLSTNSTKIVGIANAFLEAADQFAAFYAAHAAHLGFSTACAELKELQENRHFPGLPKLKRICIQHHMELMSHLNLAA